MPRAYTKSGSVEKYEPSLFETGSYSFATISSRDANGNYSITPASGYKEDSNGSYILATYYGGVSYTAKFSSSEVNINIAVSVRASYESTKGGWIVITIQRNGNTMDGDYWHDVISKNRISINFGLYVNNKLNSTYSLPLSETATIITQRVEIGQESLSIGPSIKNGSATPSSGKGTYNGVVINWKVSLNTISL